MEKPNVVHPYSEVTFQAKMMNYEVSERRRGEVNFI